MKPLFTIHGGEYLVGSFIEHNFPKVHVWIPSKDTGVDLLVSNSQNRNALALQVKFSKDFVVTHMGPVFQKHLRASGWWTIDRNKLQQSPADFWVFVVLGFAARTTDFVIVPSKELRRRLRSIHGSPKVIQSYLCITEQNRCWETRGLKREDLLQITHGTYEERNRDFTTWLNVWTPVAHLSR